MQIYYRISDKSHTKLKLPGTSKEICLKNFLSIFPEKDITIIADNCSKSYNDIIKNCWRMFDAHLGNSGSFKFALDCCVKLPDEELVYFVEDDYVHREGALKVLLEGQDLADYGTLYDHPDKYTSVYGGGETSKVVKTLSSHWRFTTSTCMTFFTKAKYLKRDYDIWMKHLSGTVPDDFGAFREIGKPIAVPIPGWACHTDLTYNGAVKDMIVDGWAITLAMKSFSLEGYEELLVGKTPWDQLMMLEAIGSIQ